MRLIGALMMVCVGCHGGGSIEPDAPILPDGVLPPLGVRVSWDADVPGNVTENIVVTDASFQLEHFQLVSDAGADARTTHSRYQLHWAEGIKPDAELFPDAPVGMYQRISLDIRPGGQPPYAYQIQGLWRDDSGSGSGSTSGSAADMKPFRIVSAMMMSLPIKCNVSLVPGGSVSFSIKLELEEALQRIDFGGLPEMGGVRVLNGGPELNALNMRMMKAFELDDDDDD